MAEKRFSEDSFVGKSVRPWYGRLKYAAIVGHVTTTSARIWIRTDGEGPHTLLLYPWNGGDDEPDRLFRRFNSVPFRMTRLPAGTRRFDFATTWETDSTAVVDVGGLAPATMYRYAVFRDDPGEPRIIVGRDRPRQFRTLTGNPQSVSFGLFSCNRPFDDEEVRGELRLRPAESAVMWDVVLETLRRRRREGAMDLVIGSGDQVYVDTLKAADIWRFLNSRMRRSRGELLPCLDDMLSWYRDIYRGYWNFNALLQVFGEFPCYMTWDDHEILDGWGSHEVHSTSRTKGHGIRAVLPDLGSKRLSHAQGRQLIDRMFQAASRVYLEYQHSHNPRTPAGQWDFGIAVGPAAIYFLDSRGHRDLYRDRFKILGEEQFERFRTWLRGPEVEHAAFVFVVVAVPLVHLQPFLGDKDVHKLVKILMPGELDDLRDSWEYEIHHEERAAVLGELFAAAGSGKTVAVLSGDVHVAASFRLSDGAGHHVWQLTSSAVTYTQPRLLGWLLGKGVPRTGTTDDGYRYERIGGVFTGSNFAVVSADAATGTGRFELFGLQKSRPPQEVAHKLGELHGAGIAGESYVADPVSVVEFGNRR